MRTLFAYRYEYYTLYVCVDKFVDKCVDILTKCLERREEQIMRHNAKRSQKGRGQQKNRNNKMRVFESNGPDAKIRGTAYQITEKYELLAKDAETSGNHVLAENYRQHAEHYYRIIGEFEEQEARQRQTFEIQDREVDDQEDDLADLVADASMVDQAQEKETICA